MPKVKTAAQYTADHETPEAAIDAAIADARSESAAARRFKRAYTPLAESLKLPTTVEDSDSAIDAARDAARDALGKLAEGPEGDPAADLLAEIAERLGLDLSALEKLADDATDEQVDKALEAALKPVTDLKAQAQDAATLRTQATYRDAADAHGWDAAKLRKIVPNLTAREVEKDGQKAPDYGVQDGDTWTALTDAVSGFEVALKRDAQPDKPTPAPLPTGQRGGTPPAAKTVEQRTAEVKREISI